MAQRFMVQSIKGIDSPATDEDLKSFKTQIEAKGWKPIAQLGNPNSIVFEVADDAEQPKPLAISGGSTIGVPDTYPREQDPVVKRY